MPGELTAQESASQLLVCLVELVGKRPFVEVLGSLVTKLPEGACQVLLLKPSTRLRRLASGKENPGCFRVPGQLVSCCPQRFLKPGGYHKSLFRNFCPSLETLLEGKGSKPPAGKIVNQWRAGN